MAGEIARRGRCRSTILILAAVVASWCALGSVAIAAPPVRYELADLKALEQAFTDLALEVRPSVVSIRCYQEVRAADQSEPPLVKLPISQGSGFIIDPSGYVATNNHVIDGADLISVVLHNGLAYDAKRVNRDSRSDLAVLRIEAEALQPVRLGDLRNVRINQWAFACGNPFGMAFDNAGKTSVTYGVVSALGRQMTQRLTGDPQRHYYGNLIESSATINPGNSGGPLFNIAGEVIGVVTAIETSTGVSEGHGFAIPIDDNTRRILDTLKRGEAFRYGFMGIEVNDVEIPQSRYVAQVRSPRGAEVARVAPPHGPAARAGLAARDIIIEFNGTDVESSDHLVRLVQYTPVGSEAEVTFVRRGVKQKTVVTLGDRTDLESVATARQ